MTKQNSKSISQFHQTSAEALYEQSMELINNSLKGCNIEGFEPVSLMMPQPITQGGFRADQIPHPEQAEFYSLAEGMFKEQNTLFSEGAQAENPTMNPMGDSTTQQTEGVEKVQPLPQQDFSEETRQEAAGESLAHINSLLNSG